MAAARLEASGKSFGGESGGAETGSPLAAGGSPLRGGARGRRLSRLDTSSPTAGAPGGLANLFATDGKKLSKSDIQKLDEIEGSLSALEQKIGGLLFGEIYEAVVGSDGDISKLIITFGDFVRLVEALLPGWSAHDHHLEDKSHSHHGIHKIQTARRSLVSFNGRHLELAEDDDAEDDKSGKGKDTQGRKKALRLLGKVFQLYGAHEATFDLEKPDQL